MKKLKKLMVLVHATPARSTFSPARKRKPSRRSCLALEPFRSTSGSATSTPRSAIAEATNESASAAIATGAVRACTRRPAVVGPAMYESERVVENLLLASTYCERWTSATKKEALERSKTTVRAPTAK